MLSLAFAFGIISEDEYGCLDIIRKIRNHAAHSIGLSPQDEFDFSREPVRGMLFEFYPKFAREAVPVELLHKVEKDFDRAINFDPKLVYRLVFCSAEIGLLGRQALTVALRSPPVINEGVEDEEAPEVTPAGGSPRVAGT
jgi:hypothetical protein